MFMFLTQKRKLINLYERSVKTMSIEFKPYDYQAHAIDKIINNKKFGLFLDMGLRQDSLNAYCH